jgi:hypothetical protein
VIERKKRTTSYWQPLSIFKKKNNNIEMREEYKRETNICKREMKREMKKCERGRQRDARETKRDERKRERERDSHERGSKNARHGKSKRK